MGLTGNGCALGGHAGTGEWARHAALLVADTGLVIRARDLKGLTDGLERLIAAGEDERRRLGETARRRIEEAFSLSAVAERFAELYEDLLRDEAAHAMTRGNVLEHM